MTYMFILKCALKLVLKNILKHVGISSQQIVIMAIVSPPVITRKSLRGGEIYAGLLANVMPQ